MSGTFNVDGTKQRILNWTAIFDEIHDFELNTRGVAGGTGAIVDDTDLNADGSANTGARKSLENNDFNLGSAAAIAREGALPDDWNDIETYLKTVRTPRGDDSDTASIGRGRALFAAGNCNNCHGGELWTLSERYSLPQKDDDLRDRSLADEGVAGIGDVRPDQVKSTDTSSLAILDNDANGAPARHTCVVRKVGTFDALGPDGRGAAEVRVNGAPAQGVDGFNVPSLLGAGRGGPFLHNGAAETLEELLDPAGEFSQHLQAGNLVFAPNAAGIADLAAFLRSIDDTTAPFEVPAGQRFCPTAIDTSDDENDDDDDDDDDLADFLDGLDD